MAEGRYYLGKFKNNEYIPVSESLCKTDPYSVMNYTARFDNEDDLRKYLISQGLIDGNETLAYIIRKSEGYRKIPNGNYLTYSNAKAYNTGEGMKATLRAEKYNYELFSYIANELASKFENAKGTVYELQCIQKIVREISQANKIGIDNYLDTYDKADLDSLIYEFLKADLGKFDKNTGRYKVVDGHLDINRRSLLDLVLLLNVYYDFKQREYLNNLEQTENNQCDEEDYEEHEEEFLTDEDFIRVGEEPDDNRKLIRDVVL